MNAAVMVFEPESIGITVWYGGDTEDDDDGEDTAILVAQDDSRRASFVVDSEAQAQSLQDLGAFGLGRSLFSAAGFSVSPPIGVAGSPNALVDGGGTRLILFLSMDYLA